MVNRLLLVLCLVGLAWPVHATTWLLQGASMDDGGPLTGSFEYDAGSNTYSGWDLSVPDGSVLSAYRYRDGVDGGLIGLHDATMADFVAYPPDTDGRYLRLVFDRPLTGAGGTVALASWRSYECNNCSLFRGVVAGQVSAVPEPSGWALFGLGLAAVGMRLSRSAGAQPAARRLRISNAGSVLPSSTSRKAPPPVEM